MRQIILDTETTGREPSLGHRIIEIGAIVIQNREITQESFHTYLNPERDSDPEALTVHGLSRSFLKDKPFFNTIFDDFLKFLVKDDTQTELIIHNAKFDSSFFNAEINLCNQSNHSIDKKPPYRMLQHYCKITDSLKLARELHPNQRNSLDALCKRYHVDNAKRNLHGALLDAELLAKVYLKMTAGQPSIFDIVTSNTQHSASDVTKHLSKFNLAIHYANLEEQAAHQQQLASISQRAGICLWENESNSY